MDSKKEKSLKKTYAEYIDLMLYDFPVDRIKEIVADDVTGYGTTIDEKVLEINRIKKIVTDQREQGAGIAMQIKPIPVHRRISPNEDTALFMDEFEVTMEINETKNVIPLRLTSVFEFIDNNWKLVHLHGSKAVETENDTWHRDEWKQKNKQLQKLVDEKTAELTKQYRELEIEATLERIRSRTIGMQRSDELQDTAMLLFQQIEALSIPVFGCGFNIWEEDQKIATAWMAGENRLQPPFQTSSKEDIFLRIYQAAQSGEDLFVEEQKGDALKMHYKYMNSIPVFKKITEGMRKAGQAFPTFQIMHCTFFSQGYLMFITYEPVDNAFDIFKRFAKVFEQTYTRFLDLQKAEKQAREAQIEAALEKIRNRSLAMHSGNELGDVVTLIVEKLKDLDVVLDANGVILCTYFNDSKDVVHWISSPDFTFAGSYFLPYFDHPIFNDAWNSKESGDEYFSKAFSVEEKNSFFEYAFEHSDYKNFPDDFKDWVFQNDQHILSFAWQKKSAILIPSHTGVVPSAGDVEILKRFARVFEQAYIRFLDLQKAEEQAREAQIEASLERVRAKTMAMHKSNELVHLVVNMNTEINSLGIQTDGSYIITDFVHDNKNEIMNLWVATEAYMDKIKLPYLKHEVTDVFFDAVKTNKSFYTESHSKAVKDSYFELLFQHTSLRNIQKERKEFILSKPAWNRSIAILKNSVLIIHRYSGIPFNDNDNTILQRFAKVFKQAYTRFLDLEKAEKQAREAQIETALERIRSRSMAMHNSEELQDVVNVVFNQLSQLDVSMEASLIDIPTNDKNGHHLWIATVDQAYVQRIYLPFVENEIDYAYHESVAKKLELLTEVFPKDVKDQYFEYLFEHSDLKHVSDERKKLIRDGLGYSVSVAFNKHTQLILTKYDGKPFSNEENKIIVRFAKVFEQTYTRFLDLQKAEAQAREAQIEAALERVRAAGMAMHSSKDLAEASTILFEQLAELGIEARRVGFALPDDEKQEFTVWSTIRGDDGKAGLLSAYFYYNQHPIYPKMIENWHAGNKLFRCELHGSDVQDYYKSWNRTFETPKALLKSIKENTTEYYQFAYFKQGIIYAFSAQPLSEVQNQLLSRFANTFELTYTRFLDLQKAEAQAREAQIETALERVRSRTMAMHKSEELAETATVLFQQLNDLGVKPERINIGIVKEDQRIIEWWSTEQGGKQINQLFKGSIDEPTTLSKVFSAWKKGKRSLVLEQSGKELTKWLKYLTSELGLPFKEDMRQDRRYQSTAFFSQGMILFTTPVPLSEETLSLLPRFAKVFEQTYTRFLDLQKAEAQAREAIKRASLDRVRGEIASMRTKDDLNRITPLIWKELITLNVPFIRCGVFIMDNINQNIQTFLSTPNGDSIAAFNLPYNTPGNFADIVTHWKQNKSYIHHWGISEFQNLADVLLQNGSISTREQYMSSMPKDGIHLNFVPFKQGMLYVGNTSPQKTDVLQLVKSLAESFSIAYARYEDFKQLEEAKLKTEKTLEELKATQTQLIQSEKMASLGELTAGIAHEIQNPLNFVNNFSEVSKELITEMREEMANKNFEEVEEISQDIDDNLEKINHHGKRASSIVKGMLEHSRTANPEKQFTDINKLADEYLRLSYHGLRAKDKSFNATFKTDLDSNLPKAKVIAQDIGRVLLNLFNNAFYACADKKNSENVEKNYKPELIVSTKAIQENKEVEISVKDNGNGIPKEALDKIFQPFFTTKPTGQGTGLGLSLSYDIITKGHNGLLEVKTKQNIGTEFIIKLPIQ